MYYIEDVSTNSKATSSGVGVVLTFDPEVELVTDALALRVDCGARVVAGALPRPSAARGSGCCGLRGLTYCGSAVGPGKNKNRQLVGAEPEKKMGRSP